MENNNGLVPASVLLRNALDFTKSKAKILYQLTAVIFASYILLALILAGGIYGGAALGGGIGFLTGSLGSLLGLVLFLIITLWTQIAIYEAIIHDVDFSQAFSQSKSKIGKFLWTSFLAGLVIIFGYILLIVPGIVFSVWYYFATMIVIAEGVTGMDALHKSKSYVKGRWWDVAWRMFFIVLVVFLVQLLLKLLFKRDVADILTAVFSFLYLPFALVYQYLLYKNLKETREMATAVVPDLPATPPVQ